MCALFITLTLADNEIPGRRRKRRDRTRGSPAGAQFLEPLPKTARTLENPLCAAARARAHVADIVTVIHRHSSFAVGFLVHHQRECERSWPLPAAKDTPRTFYLRGIEDRGVKENGKNWWTLDVDGKECFSGDVFLRVLRISEWVIVYSAGHGNVINNMGIDIIFLIDFIFILFINRYYFFLSLKYRQKILIYRQANMDKYRASLKAAWCRLNSGWTFCFRFLLEGFLFEVLTAFGEKAGRKGFSDSLCISGAVDNAVRGKVWPWILSATLCVLREIASTGLRCIDLERVSGGLSAFILTLNHALIGSIAL